MKIFDYLGNAGMFVYQYTGMWLCEYIHILQYYDDTVHLMRCDALLCQCVDMIEIDVQ